jgi:hypothetical protein
MAARTEHACLHSANWYPDDLGDLIDRFIRDNKRGQELRDGSAKAAPKTLRRAGLAAIFPLDRCKILFGA